MPRLTLQSPATPGPCVSIALTLLVCGCNHREIRGGQVVILDGVLDTAQLAAARSDVGRLRDGGRCVWVDRVVRSDGGESPDMDFG
jgi:hypothetical protein